MTVDRQLDPTGAKQRVITLLDHVGNDGLVTADGLATTPVDRYGNDYLAGGADDDLIFGQLGDDVIQGDGSIGAVQADGSIERTVGASRAEGEGQALSVMVSVEAVTDGDDYIEGNGGDDVIFGNLGQDDIVGGSSDLFGLVARSQRPDGRDMIFGGAGTESRDEVDNVDGEVDEGDGLHARDADMIAGDNANIFRLVGVNGAARTALRS